MRPAVFILMLAITGCASAPRTPEAVDWSQRKAQLMSLQSWRMTGSVAVSVDGEGASARIDWRQAGETSDLSLSGPLGVGALRAIFDSGDLSLEDGSGNSLHGDDARAVLGERLGTDIPLAALRYWILGMSEPGLPAQESIGLDGRPVRIEQAGWLVAIDRYSSAAAGGLPARLSATKGGARIKLAVNRWDIGKLGTGGVGP
jgi:outer membrane lipoprotein LolB